MGVFGAAAVEGLLVALYYHRLDLTLSHYDARGHLIVARRIFDSITPGWQQIGAVWLPLPHLLNALPVQIDAFYRSGASAVAISIASFALTAAAIAWMVFAVTQSRAAALAGTAVFALNPNVLYLQATPMTEPLLFGLMTLAVALLMSWTSAGLQSWLVGWVFALACLTRYEAWPVTGCALVAAVWARRRGGASWSQATRAVSRVAAYPLIAVLGFLLFSRVVIGEWFVDSGFFVPENLALDHPYLAVSQIVWGARALSGYALVSVAAVGLLVLATTSFRDRRYASGLIALSLMATAAVPWAAFVKGHPFRIRYMVPLIVIEAIGAGVVAGLSRRTRIAGAIVVLAIAAIDLRPLDLTAPMVVEAQWDRPNVPVRKHVTDCLVSGYRGETIMASMGSVGHYMQELSLAGFDLRDFLHEGNGDIWLAALQDPRPYAGWMLIEEKAEGGDMLAQLARKRPAFLEGFSRVCDGAGIALYRRDPRVVLTRTRY